MNAHHASKCLPSLPTRIWVRLNTGNSNKLTQADNHLWENPSRGHWMTITQKEDSFIARDTLSTFPKGSQFLLTISQNHLEADVN